MVYKFQGYTFSHYENDMAIYYEDTHKTRPFTWDYSGGEFMELYGNKSFYYPPYPRTAYKDFVENYEYIDNNYKEYYNRNIEDNSEFYYGYKECQKLGRAYNAPDPRMSNNLPLPWEPYQD